jgi:hypothetical protein
VTALREELELRIATEARLNAQLAEIEGRLEARGRLESRLETTFARLRDELDVLRAAAERESAGRAEAESRAARLERQLHDYGSRSERAYDAIEELRGELDSVRAAQAEASQPLNPAGPVESGRLEAALARLREATPAAPAEDLGETPPQAASVAPHARAPKKAWLARVFKRLVAEDPVTAGRLLLALLPAQRAVHPEPVAYDLILGELACVRVTADDGAPEIEFADAPRAPQDVQFQVSGDLASVARAVLAGRLRRRLGRGLARVKGDQDAFGALAELVRAPLSMRELHAAGVRLDPHLALTVVSLMFDPGWTAGASFTLAHQATGSRVAETYLNVRDGHPLSVSDAAPPSPPETTIVCPPDSLLLVLAGVRRSDTFVRGEHRPLELLEQWLERAQSS